MGVYSGGNAAGANKIRYISGQYGGYLDSRAPYTTFQTIYNRIAFNNTAIGFPDSYPFSTSLRGPFQVGTIAATIDGSGYIVSSIYAIGSLSSTIDATSIVIANSDTGVEITCIISDASGYMEAPLFGKGTLTCVIDIAARPTAFDIAQAVLNAIASQYNLPGTIGNKINAAASAGDPWTTTIPGSYPSGSAGYILGNNLDMKISDVSGGTDVSSIWDYTSRTLTEGAPIDASTIWDYSSRTLTSGSPIDVTSIWEYENRSLTDRTGFYISGDKTTLDDLNDIEARTVWDYRP